MTSIKSFLIFIAKPDFNECQNKSPLERILITGKFFIIAFLLMIAVQLLEDLILTLDLYSSPKHILDSYLESSRSTPSGGSSLKIVLLSSLLVAPILEEFQFRLLLKKYNPILISISLSLIVGLFSYRLLSSHLWKYYDGIIQGLFPALYNLIFALLFFFPIWIIISRISDGVWNNNARFVFYSSALSFTLIHITNYQIESTHYLFLPLILLPYFIYSIVFGFIRIRLGIMYSVVIHGLSLIPTFVKIIAK